MMKQIQRVDFTGGWIKPRRNLKLSRQNVIKVFVRNALDQVPTALLFRAW